MGNCFPKIIPFNIIVSEIFLKIEIFYALSQPLLFQQGRVGKNFKGKNDSFELQNIRLKIINKKSSYSPIVAFNAFERTCNIC